MSSHVSFIFYIIVCLFDVYSFSLLKAEMKRFAGTDTSVLKQHYEKKVHELEQEKRALQVIALSKIYYKLNYRHVYRCNLYIYVYLYKDCLYMDIYKYVFSFYLVSFQKEIEELRCNLSNISSTSDDGAQKLKQEYLQKLNFLETQVNWVAWPLK